jgi:hypothetical protein
MRRECGNLYARLTQDVVLRAARAHARSALSDLVSSLADIALGWFAGRCDRWRDGRCLDRAEGPGYAGIAGIPLQNGYTRLPWAAGDAGAFAAKHRCQIDIDQESLARG